MGTASRMAATAATMAPWSWGVTTPRPEVTMEKREAPAAAASRAASTSFSWLSNG